MGGCRLKYQVIGDYVLEYDSRLGDFVHLTIWKTHRDNILPFSEVIYQLHLKPTPLEVMERLVKT